MPFAPNAPATSEYAHGGRAMFFSSSEVSSEDALGHSLSAFGSSLSTIEECTIVVLGLWDSPRILHDIQHLIRALQCHCGPVRGAHRFPVKPPPCLVRPEYPGVVLAVTFATVEAAAMAISIATTTSAGPKGDHVTPIPSGGRRGGEVHLSAASWCEGLRMAPIRMFRLTPEEAEDCRKAFMPVSMVLESLRNPQRFKRDSQEEKSEMTTTAQVHSYRSSSSGGSHRHPGASEDIFSHIPPPHTLPHFGRGWKVGEEKRRGYPSSSSLSSSFSSPEYYQSSFRGIPPMRSTVGIPTASSGNVTHSHRRGVPDEVVRGEGHLVGAAPMMEALPLMDPPTAREMELMLHSSDRWGIREKLWFVLCSPLSWYTSVVDWEAVELAATSRGDAVVIDEETLCAVFTPDLSFPRAGGASFSALAPYRDGTSSFYQFSTSTTSTPTTTAERAPSSSISTGAGRDADTWNQENDALTAMQRQYGISSAKSGERAIRALGSRGGGGDRSKREDRGRGLLRWGHARDAKKDHCNGRNERERGWGGEWKRWISFLMGEPAPSSLSSSSPSSRVMPRYFLSSPSQRLGHRILHWLIPGWNGRQQVLALTGPSSMAASSAPFFPSSTDGDTEAANKTVEAEEKKGMGSTAIFGGRTSTGNMGGSLSSAQLPLLLMPFAEPPSGTTSFPFSTTLQGERQEGVPPEVEVGNKAEKPIGETMLFLPSPASAFSSPSPPSVKERFAAYQAAKLQLLASPSPVR